LSNNFPQNTQTIKSNSLAFVDDTDGINLDPLNDIPKLVSITQRSAQRWSKWKCSVRQECKKETTVSYLITLKFYGKKTYMSKQEITSTYPPLFISQHFSDPPCKIEIINASSSKKSLGCHLLLNDNKHQQIAWVHKITDKWIFHTSTAKVSKLNGVYTYHTYLFGCLHHLLATTCIKNWLAANGQKLIPKMCSILSLNSRFPRHILNLSYSWGGLNLTSIFSIQGIEKLNILVGHLRSKSFLG